ncbi:MAG: glutamine synthetase type III, partial [Lachnospiraceae bacterium]|nr:glutamine synthetase type III [Lachnospiraceae bacterium]
VLADQIYERTGEVEKAVISLANASDIIAESAAIRDDLLPKMGELRAVVDEAETLVSSKDWPYPSYGDMLFSVR